MPKLKLGHILSCSSEDSVQVAKNLLNNDSNLKWVCKSIGESSASVIIQLEKESKICGVDIGNENSAFVEILVGRASTQDYQILLPTSSFMTPMDARNLANNNRVRLFNYDDLDDTNRNEKWDRVKIICTQPFNKRVQYGLSFITIHSKDDQMEEENQGSALGKFHLRPESPNSSTSCSLFAKRKDKTGARNTMTLAQEIKTSVTPKCNEIKIKPSTSSSKIVDTEIKNRNRINLFYDSDDDLKNGKIDKVMDKIKQEEEKNKKQKQPTPRKINKEEDKKKPEKVNKTEKNNPSTSTLQASKRKLEQTSTKAVKKPKRETRLFNELLKGVVFTISGVINPERANIRQMALNLGAKYKPDWDNSCTHLICAFANTPKFLQVQGKGKIVTKDWIKDCHSQRKHLPWRRYALDRNDQGKSESEEEVEEATKERKDERKADLSEPEEDNKPRGRINYSDYLSGSDTDDEIEKILIKQKAKTGVLAEVNDEGKNKEEDVEVPIETIDEYGAETDEEKFEKKIADLGEQVPKLFKTEIFYIDNVFSDNEKSKLERLIKGFNGAILTRISNILDFVITNENSAENMKNKTQAKCISPQWIYECHDELKLVSFDRYLL